MSYEQDFYWPDDEMASAQRAFRHGPWQGRPRNDWNASAMSQGYKPCEGCGYKCHEADFYYSQTKNGIPEKHQTCWNCWMLDTKQADDFWAKVDAEKNYAPKAKQSGSLKTLGAK